MTSPFDDLSVLTADIQNYVVAPIAAFGLGGFVFDAEGETMAHLSADITDHYAEDNKSFQDHIAIKPKKITLKGYVGEVVYNQTSQTQQFLQSAAQKLTTLSAFLPTLSSSAQQIYSAATSPGDSTLTLSDASNIFGLMKNLLGAVGSQARQQNAYTYFRALMEQGILMAIQTPWEFMTNMAIESVVALQREDSIYISDFSVTYKQLRIAQTISAAYTTNLAGQPSTVDPLSPQANQAALSSYRAANGLATPPVDIQLQGAAALQAPNPVQIGNVPGIGLPTTVLPSWQSQLNSVQSIISNPGAMSILNYATTPAP